MIEGLPAERPELTRFQTSPVLPVRRDEQLELLRTFLHARMDRLREHHRQGAGGIEITRELSGLMDGIVASAWQSAASATEAAGVQEVALAALGGYGRQELSPASDVDLVFLLPWRWRPASLEPFIKHVLYLLWDLGLTVGHGVRTIGECIRLARQDVKSCNAMAEGRFLLGNLDLFVQLKSSLRRKVFGRRGRRRRFLEAMTFQLKERYRKHEKRLWTDEPDLKEGPGGLRDLHMVQWVGRALLECEDLEDLHLQGHLPEEDIRRARQAQDFMLRLRNEIHFHRRWRIDRVSVSLQREVALSLGYPPAGELEARELLMRDYRRHAHEIHLVCKSFLARLQHAAGYTVEIKEL